MSLFAKKVNLLKHCTFPIPEFQGCIPEGFCGDAITYACPIDIEPEEPYEFLDTCIPIDFAMCDTPLLSGDCE
ncbi:MAG TPA: hypothetical protein ENJ18_18995 [Nannocystis exedens]|nr:hypothetical protein [Nannocystis exedens]